MDTIKEKLYIIKLKISHPFPALIYLDRIYQEIM